MEKMQLLFSVAFLLSHIVSGQSKDDNSSSSQVLTIQKEAYSNQDSLHKTQLKQSDEQKEEYSKQESLDSAQLQKSDEQRKVAFALKEELLKDGLIKKDEEYTFIINSREMLINGRRQPDEVHVKYIALINNKRKAPFGSNEEWRVEE